MVNKKILGWVGTTALAGLAAVGTLIYAGNGKEEKELNKPAVKKEIKAEEKTETKKSDDETESKLEKQISEAGYNDVWNTIEGYELGGYIPESALKSIKKRISEIKGHPSIADGIGNKEAKENINKMEALYNALEEDFYQNAEVDLGIMMHINYDGKHRGVGSSEGNRITISGIKFNDIKEILGQKDYSALLENRFEEMPEADGTGDMPGVTITFEDLVKLSEKGEYNSESRDFDGKYLSNLKDGNNGNYEIISATSTVFGEPKRNIEDGYLESITDLEAPKYGKK